MRRWFELLLDKSLLLKRVKDACDTGALIEAVDLCDAYLRHNGQDIDVWYRMGVIKGVQEDFSGAVRCFKEVVVQSPRDVNAHVQLAKGYRLMGDYQASLRHLEQLADLVEDPSGIYCEMASALKILGRFTQAESVLRKAIRLKPDCTDAYRSLTAIKHFDSLNDSDLAAMEGLSRQPGLSVEQLIYLHFALAKAYEDVGHYDAAFRSMEIGNNLTKKPQHSGVESDEHLFNQISQTFNKAFFSARKDFGVNSRVPIFVVGIPRSGTTLVEQIISSHRDVCGAGEIKDFMVIVRAALNGNPIEYFNQLDRDFFQQAAKGYLNSLVNHCGNSVRVTDKSIANFHWIGLIRIMFPNAKVVHCCRNPMDNCLAIYKKYLFKAQRYSNDLVNLGRYYLAYKKLMDHWHQELPGFVYDVHYEALVSDQELQTRSLIEFCGLEWDEHCLRFQENDRPVMTSSLAQVRTKLYTDSVAKWRRYKDHLKPLLSLLDINSDVT